MMRTALALALIAGPAAALDLTLPIDCEMGVQCYIQSYVDRDPGPGYSDYTCGTLSYDGHKGVDFRVRTLAEMQTGIDILAAAPGRVRGLRDGEPDTGAEQFEPGKDCGNGVVIAHEGGWETQYCHLAKGSVTVRPGQTVARGDVLGQMGYSGRTEFPHLHLSVRKDGAPVDPFGAQPMAQACAAPDTASLWTPETAAALAYQPGGVVDLGVTDAAPSLRAIRRGSQATLRRSGTEAIIFWSRFYGVREGDELTLTLTGPTGVIVDNRTIMTRKRAEEMRYAGRKRAGGWPAGLYRGEAVLSRDGDVIDRSVESFTLR